MYSTVELPQAQTGISQDIKVGGAVNIKMLLFRNFRNICIILDTAIILAFQIILDPITELYFAIALATFLQKPSFLSPVQKPCVPCQLSQRTCYMVCVMLHV